MGELLPSPGAPPFNSQHSEGAPFFERIVLEGWDSTDLNRAPIIEFRDHAEEPRSLSEVRSLPLHHVQLLAPQAAVG